MWFEDLTGFVEQTGTDGAAEVRRNISVDGNEMTMWSLGRIRACGRLETPSLAALRDRAGSLPASIEPKRRPRLSEIVADVQDLHTDNAGALFQVASQFNLLEMVSPDVSPDDGVTRYAYDRTQGPACAIACGAGTIYRNYFAPVNGEIGQSEHNQIDCLGELGAQLGNSDGRLWQMRNGYALPSKDGLAETTRLIESLSLSERNVLMGHLRIGVQWDTEVTLTSNPTGQNHLVTQAYCSALPVAYSGLPSSSWDPFAKLILDAAYEATIIAGALNAAATRNPTVFLTLLGGGAFGNDPEWIIDAIERALLLPVAAGLDVAVVSYGAPSPEYAELAKRMDQHQVRADALTEIHQIADEAGMDL